MEFIVLQPEFNSRSDHKLKIQAKPWGAIVPVKITIVTFNSADMFAFSAISVISL